LFIGCFSFRHRIVPMAGSSRRIRRFRTNLAIPFPLRRVRKIRTIGTPGMPGPAMPVDSVALNTLLPNVNHTF
jgi:hypothetical protein